VAAFVDDGDQPEER